MALTKINTNGVSDSAITSAKINDGAITNDDINATLDLSSKTVTLPAASVTAHATNPTKASIEALGIDLPAADLTGTIADARFPSTLPAISGANLTGIETVTKSTTAPSSPSAGDMWFNSSASTVSDIASKCMASYSGTAWDQMSNVPVVYTAATGGTITTDGDYKVHTFNSSSTFTVTTLGDDDDSFTVLVQAGGGGGGYSTSGWGGGGGGAGGLLYHTSKSLSNTAYPVTIGAGAASLTSMNTSNLAYSGSNSVFSDLTAYGGGGGAGRENAYIAGANGGCGGGGEHTGGSSSSTQTSSGGATAYGYGGGAGYTSPPYYCGGGGGTAAAGAAGAGGGAGGAGGAFTITGASINYGGGGGGSGTQSATHPAGGIGGGGAGGNNTGDSGTSGTVNTGGGGGGRGYYATGSGVGGAGGSGIVIIRYKFQ